MIECDADAWDMRTIHITSDFLNYSPQKSFLTFSMVLAIWVVHA